tara:strand:+ start:1399 stop:1533 length:135 start_codon:yes stop_codon:yes gene_type:complete
MTRELIAYALMALLVLIVASAVLLGRRDARRKHERIWGKKRRKK